MNRIIIFLALLMLFSNNIGAVKKVQLSTKFCSGIDKKISQVDKVLRAGYSLKKGEILKHKLRKLKKLKYACWMKRLPTK